MGRRLYIKHCVLNRVTRQHGPHPTSDLLGVDYFVTVPADTEFPKLYGRLELFVRVFGIDMPATWVRVTVSRRRPAGGRDRIYSKRFVLPFTG